MSAESDPTTPPRPEAPYFDRTRDAWIVSRYRDVYAALREQRLWPVAARGEDQSKTRDGTGRLHLRTAAQESLAAARVAEWEARIAPVVRRAVDGLPDDRPVDLVREFAQPWCLALAMLVLDADPGDARLLADLGEQVFAGTGVPDDSPLRPRAAAATAELERIFAKGPLPMGEPTFVAVSQTLPRLLGNMWLALLRNPAELARLEAQPDLIPGAVEELLRYAGIVRRIWRRAMASLELGGVTMAEGERAMLMLASANRDPEQFPEPDRLDVTRHVTGQVALGTGRNSCVGAALIRMAAGLATGAAIGRFARAELSGTIEWRAGSGYGWPASVYVTLRREPPTCLQGTVPQ